MPSVVEIGPTGRELQISCSAGDGVAVGEALRRSGISARRRGDVLDVGWPDAAGLDEVDAPLSWEPDAQRWVCNRAQVAASAEAVRARIAEIRAAGANYARSSLEGFHWTDVLDDHQIVNVGALSVPDGWGGCVFDEQGTGKTPTIVATFDVLHDRNVVDVMLIVAPKSMVAEWPVELDRFTNGLFRTVVLEGSRAQKASLIASGADVLVCNYESVASTLQNLKLFASQARIMLVLDESFFVKNPEAARSIAVWKIREHCTRAYVLCGTPAPNSPSDLVAQFDLVDFGYTFSGVNVDADRDAAALQIRTVLTQKGMYSRSLKSETLPDLPARLFSQVSVKMEGDQLRAYRSALSDLVLDLRNTTDNEFDRQFVNFLQRRSALLRICSDPGAVVPGYAQTPAKILALDQILGGLVDRDGEKVVLWSFYRSSLDHLAARYERYGVVRVDGSITETTERRNAVRSFQEDPDTRLFVGNPAAAAAGLTLHSARYAVYESLSNQAAHYLQSLDRIHRRGQERPVEYITLLCKDSIEEAEYDTLQRKAARQADLLGDPDSERVTRSVMLGELSQGLRPLDGD